MALSEHRTETIPVTQLAQQLGWSVPEVVEVVDVFLASSQQLLGDIRGAIEEGNSRQLAAAAHSLKGASLNVRLEQLAERARQLEQVATMDQASAVVSEIEERLARIVEWRESI